MLPPVPIVLLVVGQVVMRGGVAPPEGDVVAVNAAGVTIRGPSSPARAGTEHVVSLDRVLDIGGTYQIEWAQQRTNAVDTWRARTRLERGDILAAEPLFDRLFEQYRDRTGPTAGVIAEGLLRCRLARHAQTTAIEPWILLQRAGGPHLFESATYRGQPTSLIPSLPPIWLDTPAADAFASAPLPVDIGAAVADPASARALALAELYHHAAAIACGIDSTLPEQTSRDPDVRFVLHIVLAHEADPKARADARLALREVIAKDPEPWVEAWCRAAIGRSLLLEPDTEQRLLGVVQLLHLPARLDNEFPYLAGVALAQAAAAIKDSGDQDGADQLHQDLIDEFGGHPALDWAPIRNWRNAVHSRGATHLTNAPLEG